MIRSLFGESTERLAPKTTLKNPNMYRESVVYDTISRLPRKKIDEFVKSEEAKVLMECGYLSQETLERLAKEQGMHGSIKTLACHLAKENHDPDFEAFVNANREAHMAMERMIERYGCDAKPIADECECEVKKIIPEYFQK